MRTLLVAALLVGCRSSTPSAPPTAPLPVPAPADAPTTDGDAHPSGQARDNFEYGLEGAGPGGTGSGWGIVGSPSRATPAPRPRIEMGRPTASSQGIDVAVLHRYLRRSTSGLEACYEKQPPTLPKLEGAVNVTFTVGSDGAVTAAKAGGVGDEALHACVAAAIRATAFSKPRDGKPVEVSSAITFHSPGH